jgi:purine-nucleoside phosphorylase
VEGMCLRSPQPERIGKEALLSGIFWRGKQQELGIRMAALYESKEPVPVLAPPVLVRMRSREVDPDTVGTFAGTQLLESPLLLLWRDGVFQVQRLLRGVNPKGQQQLSDAFHNVNACAVQPRDNVGVDGGILLGDAELDWGIEQVEEERGGDGGVIGEVQNGAVSAALQTAKQTEHSKGRFPVQPPLLHVCGGGMAGSPVVAAQQKLELNLRKMPPKDPNRGNAHQHVSDAVLPQQEHPRSGIELEDRSGSINEHRCRGAPAPEHVAAESQFQAFEQWVSHRQCKTTRASAELKKKHSPNSVRSRAAPMPLSGAGKGEGLLLCRRTPYTPAVEHRFPKFAPEMEWLQRQRLHWSELARRLREQLPQQPHAAVILGSGLGGQALPAPLWQCRYEELEGFPRSTVAGHSGELRLCRLSGIPVLLFLGRFHLYEGYRLEQVVAPVILGWLLGARAFVLTNAAGAVNPELAPGELVLVRDVLDFTLRSLPVDGEFRRHYSCCFLPHTWRRAVRECIGAQGIACVEGTYAAMLGPMYETPAEIRFLRFAGADVVGMSTVHELACAVALGCPVLVLSLVTNAASGNRAAPLTHAEVLSVAQQSARQLWRCVEIAVAQMPAE